MGKITKQLINILAASFYPAMLGYYKSDEGKAEYQRYLDEQADLAKSARADNADDNNNKAADGTHAA